MVCARYSMNLPAKAGSAMGRQIPRGNLSGQGKVASSPLSAAETDADFPGGQHLVAVQRHHFPAFYRISQGNGTHLVP